MKQNSESLVDEVENKMEFCDVLCQLGLLIIESRQPEISSKGRMEGPHCLTNSNNQQSHQCDFANEMCKKKEVIEREILSLWKNKIPICIEVLLLPPCRHGENLASMSDTSINSLKGKCLLLEQWKIQEVHKRPCDNIVSFRNLFQVVNSYLYFSQLSAWLNQAMGKIPGNIAYRICPPGDFCTSSFHKSPEVHQFPLCSKSRNPLAIQVSISTLPRQNDIPVVPCSIEHSKGGKEKPNMQNVVNPEKEEDCNSLTMSNFAVSEDGVTLTMGRASRYRTNSCSAECDYEVITSSSSAATSEKTSDSLLISTNINQSPTYINEPFPSIQNMQEVHPSQVELEREPRKSTLFTQSDHPEIPVDGKYVTNGTNVGCTSPEEKCSGANDVSFNIHQSVSYQEIFSLSPLQPEEELSSKTNVVKERDKVSDNSSPDHISDNNDIKFDICYDETENSFRNDRQVYYNNSLFSSSSKYMNLNENHQHIDNNEQHLYLKDDEKCNEFLPFHLQKLSPENEAASSDGEYSYNEIDSILTKALDTRLTLDGSVNGMLGLSKLCGSENSSHSSTGSTTSSVAIQSSKAHFRNSEIHKAPECGLDCSILPPPISPKSFKEYRYSSKHDINHLKQVPQDSIDQSISYHKNVPIITPSSLALKVCNDEEDSYNAQCNNSITQGKNTMMVSSNSQMCRRSFPSAPEKLCAMALVTPHRPKAPSLFKTIVDKEADEVQQILSNGISKALDIPTEQAQQTFHRNLYKSAAAVFNSSSGLPLQSSPAPIKKKSRRSFDFDENLVSVKGIKNSFSCVNLDEFHDKKEEPRKKFYSTSAPASTNSLLGNFEESMLNGRLEPCGVVEGFTVEIGASGQFCPQHVNLPLTAFFFNLSEDNAPSPYLGHINLDIVGKRGYHVPKQGTIQVTLFNPNKTVVKMFVVMYDLRDMPANCRTFLRQRTLYMPVKGGPSDVDGAQVYLRYLIHLRFASSKSQKIYLHSDIRIIFARDKFEFDSRIANYELRSFTEKPTNPTFSPKR